MKLYEIGNQYLCLLQKIEEGEIEEAFIADTLEAVEGDFQDKADNIACYIKSLLCEAVALKEESDNLTARRKAKEGKAESLRLYLERVIVQSGLNKVETARNVMTVKKNPPSVRIEICEDKFVDWAVKNERWDVVRRSYSIDKTAIKHFINHGDTVEFCSLQQSEKLNIK